MSVANGESAEPRLFGVLVTYRRPDDLEQYLTCLRRQSRSLDGLIVVDNAANRVNRLAVEAYRDHAPATYVESPDNSGPAGGIAQGMRAVLRAATDQDWVVLLDDDNPPRTDDVLQWVFDFSAEVRDDVHVGAVGLTGSRFDLSRARFVRLADDELNGTIDVDHVGGGQFPMVRVAAIRNVGVFRSELFWGLEELEYGLRLRAHGYRILVSGELVRWARAFHGRLGRSQPKAAVSMSRVPWRQYYILRNMIDILRRNGHPWVAARVAVTRGIGKSTVHALRTPRQTGVTARLTYDAITSGWRGELGRSVEPETATVP